MPVCMCMPSLCRRQLAALEQSVEVLRTRQARFKALAAHEAAHAQLPISGHVLALRIKPLTPEVWVV